MYREPQLGFEPGAGKGAFATPASEREETLPGIRGANRDGPWTANGEGCGGPAVALSGKEVRPTGRNGDLVFKLTGEMLGFFQISALSVHSRKSSLPKLSLGDSRHEDVDNPQ